MSRLCARVDADRGDVNPQPFSTATYFRAVTDIKIWAYAMILFSSSTISYALAFFLPIILSQSMGFSVGVSQCLNAPPHAFAAAVIYLCGWAGDKYRIRGPLIIANSLLCIIGLPIMGFLSNPGVRYFGVFLVAAGANANIPAATSFQANNIRGQWKRAFASALFVSFGGIGGIAGSLVFRGEDAPTYKPGLYACIACSVLNIIVVVALTFALRRLNGQADRGEKELEYEEVSPGFLSSDVWTRANMVAG